MTYYHAVMLDECGGEFGAGVEAANKDEAHDKLRDNYPESRVDQLETHEEMRERQYRVYKQVLLEEGDDDEEDPYWEDDEDFEDDE